jgi:hypothetical protein
MGFNNTVILITRLGMGQGPEKLQVLLLSKYLAILLQNNDLPAAMCFYTDGVKVVAGSTDLLDSLVKLEQKGVRLIACSTCLESYGLANQLKVGIAGSMADILEVQALADKVITL